MQRNTSVTLGDHFSDFIKSKISQGRFDNTSEAIRAGLRLLEVEETKLEALRSKLAEGEADHALVVRTVMSRHLRRLGALSRCERSSAG